MAVEAVEVVAEEEVDVEETSCQCVPFRPLNDNLRPKMVTKMLSLMFPTLLLLFRLQVEGKEEKTDQLAATERTKTIKRKEVKL